MQPSYEDLDTTQEPVGIVISRGSRAEATPRWSAFVWGPAPELAPEVPHPKAA